MLLHITIFTCVSASFVLKQSPLFFFQKREDGLTLYRPLLLLCFMVPAYAIVITGRFIRHECASTFGYMGFSIYIVPFASPPLRSPRANRSFNRKRPRPFRFSTLKHRVFFIFLRPLHFPCPRGMPRLKLGPFLQHRLNSL